MCPYQIYVHESCRKARYKLWPHSYDHTTGKWDSRLNAVCGPQALRAYDGAKCGLEVAVFYSHGQRPTTQHTSSLRGASFIARRPCDVGPRGYMTWSRLDHVLACWDSTIFGLMVELTLSWSELVSALSVQYPLPV